MMVDEDDLSYLKKKDIGIFSSDDDEDNKNSMDSEENYQNEIERILIEIYNKNISLINSGIYYDNNREENYIKQIYKEVAKYLKKKSFKTNLCVLKCLGEIMKDLIIKYKEKLLKIDEIMIIYNLYKKKSIENYHQIYNNSLGNNSENNLNNSSESISNDEIIFFNDNNGLLNLQDDKVKDNIKILLRELINIKKTLENSVKEIEGIFAYPLRLLKKNEKGIKINFSFKLMQIEEFCKTLLYDDFIYFLITKIKESLIKSPNLDFSQMIDELERNCEHKNEMTRFIKYINEKLMNLIENKKIESKNFLEDKIKNISNNNKDIQNTKNACSETKEENNNTKKKNKNKKKRKKKEKRKIENDNNFKDIEELLNYINDETNSDKEN